MKPVFALCLFVLALFSSGCAGTGSGSASSQADRCETYAAVYSLYTATAPLREVSKDEAAAAAVAAAFLSLRCGWSPAAPGDVAQVPEPVANRTRGPAPGLYVTNGAGMLAYRDGVPVLLPPEFLAPARQRSRAAPALAGRPVKLTPNDPDHLHVILPGGGLVSFAQ